MSTMAPCDCGPDQTAGLTLAARLTEDPDVNVLVLEAGQANINDPAICTPPLVTVITEPPS